MLGEFLMLIRSRLLYPRAPFMQEDISNSDLARDSKMKVSLVNVSIQQTGECVVPRLDTMEHVMPLNKIARHASHLHPILEEKRTRDSGGNLVNRTITSRIIDCPVVAPSTIMVLQQSNSLTSHADTDIQDLQSSGTSTSEQVSAGTLTDELISKNMDEFCNLFT